MNIFWEGHKNMTKFPSWFDAYEVKKNQLGDFVIFLWPSQNIWTLLNRDFSYCSIYAKLNFQVTKWFKSILFRCWTVMRSILKLWSNIQRRPYWWEIATKSCKIDHYHFCKRFSMLFFAFFSKITFLFWSFSFSLLNAIYLSTVEATM